MSDIALRLIIVAAVVLGAALIAWIVRRFARPPHPEVDVGDVGDRPGVVLFTSTTCPTCKEVIALLQDMGVPYREVTSDLEEHRFETWGVVAVPVTVVVDKDSRVTGTYAGVPKRRSLAQAVRAAGVETM